VAVVIVIIILKVKEQVCIWVCLLLLLHALRDEDVRLREAGMLRGRLRVEPACMHAAAAWQQI
jgi:hypothetical protein